MVTGATGTCPISAAQPFESRRADRGPLLVSLATMRVSCLVMVLLLSACGNRRVLADLEPALAPSGAKRPDGGATSTALQALVAEADGDVERAEKSWQWLVRAHPGDAAAWAQYGLFLERRQRGADALEAYARSIALDGEAAPARLGSARVLLARGDEQGAAAHLVVAVAAGDPDAMHLLARQRLRLGDGAGAWAVYEKWADLPPTRAGECLDRARVALALGRASLAVDHLKCALDHEGAGPDVGATMVGSARESCRVGTAWRWTIDHRVAEREAPEWHRIALDVGRAAGDPDLVAAAVGPTGAYDPALTAERVEILLRSDRAPEALGLLDEGVRHEPGAAVWRVYRAELLARLHRLDDAVADLDEVAPEDRLFPAAERLRAQIDLAAGRPEFAVARLGALPEPPWASVILMAEALVASGRADDAEVVLHGTGRVDEAERWRQIGRLRASRGDEAGAVEAYDAAGADPRALFDKATLLERADHPREVVGEAWAKAAKADPKNAAAWLGVARASEFPESALIEAIRADRCDPIARRAYAEVVSGCDAVRQYDLLWDAAPRDPMPSSALAPAYRACVDERRPTGQPNDDLAAGLGNVEWSWRMLERHDEADRVADLRRSLEGL